MVGLLQIDDNPNKVLVVDDTMTKWEVAFMLIISFVFAFNFVWSLDISAAFEIRESIFDVLTSTSFDSEGRKFEDISSKNNLSMFLSNVIIQQVSAMKIKFSDTMRV
jgi:hypothetical protein